MRYSTVHNAFARQSAYNTNNCCFSEGRVLLVSVTHACNQNCIHCMRDAAPGRIEAFPLDRFAPLFLQAIAKHNPDRIVISGGEPTMLPNLPELVKLASNERSHVTLCTNATTVTWQSGKRLVEAGLHGVTVGLEGVKGEYDKFRRSPQGFKRLEKGLSILQSLQIPITINISVWNELFDQVDDIIEFLCSYDLAAICVTSPILQGRLLTHLDKFFNVTIEGIEEFVGILASNMPCPVQLRLPRCSSSSCPSGKEVFTILPNGVVSGCLDKDSVNIVDGDFGKVFLQRNAAFL